MTLTTPTHPCPNCGACNQWEHLWGEHWRCMECREISPPFDGDGYRKWLKREAAKEEVTEASFVGLDARLNHANHR